MKKQDSNNWSSMGLGFIRLCTRSPVRMQDFYAHHLAMTYSNQDGIFNHNAKSASQNKGGTKRKEGKEDLLVYKLLLQKTKGPSMVLLYNAAEKLVSRETDIDSIGPIAIKFQCKNIYGLRENLFQKGYEVSRIARTPGEELSFFLRDPEYNYLYFHEEIESANRNKKIQRTEIRRMSGFMIGVNNIEDACAFYKRFTACDTVLFDKRGEFPDLKILAPEHDLRRIKLIQTQKTRGLFSQHLFGSELELIEVQNNASGFREQDASMYQVKRCSIGSVFHNLEGFLQHGMKENFFSVKPKLHDLYSDGIHVRYAYIQDPSEITVICIEVLAIKEVSGDAFTRLSARGKIDDAKSVIQSLLLNR